MVHAPRAEQQSRDETAPTVQVLTERRPMGHAVYDNPSQINIGSALLHRIICIAHAVCEGMVGGSVPLQLVVVSSPLRPNGRKSWDLPRQP